MIKYDFMHIILCLLQEICQSDNPVYSFRVYLKELDARGHEQWNLA